MSIAEKWLRNYWPDYESMVPQTVSMHLLLEYLDTVANAALELAAQEAEKVAKQNDADAEQGWYQQNNWLAETAARIRALKSSAQEPESA